MPTPAANKDRYNANNAVYDAFALDVPADTEAAHDWLALADDSDRHASLDDALVLSAELGVKITLKDDRGFIRGWVHPDGSYTLQ